MINMYLCLLGALIWFVISELFFGSSANRVYASALKKVKASAEVSYSMVVYMYMYVLLLITVILTCIK